MGSSGRRPTRHDTTVAESAPSARPRPHCSSIPRARKVVLDAEKPISDVSRAPTPLEPLGGEFIGLEEVADDVWAVHFGPVALGWLHFRRLSRSLPRRLSPIRDDKVLPIRVTAHPQKLRTDVALVACSLPPFPDNAVELIAIPRRGRHCEIRTLSTQLRVMALMRLSL